jgi:hypothetical protein
MDDLSLHPITCKSVRTPLVLEHAPTRSRITGRIARPVHPLPTCAPGIASCGRIRSQRFCVRLILRSCPRQFLVWLPESEFREL